MPAKKEAVIDVYQTEFEMIRLSEPIAFSLDRLRVEASGRPWRKATKAAKKRRAEVEAAICLLSETCWLYKKELKSL